MVFMFVGYVWAGVPNPAAVYCKQMGFDSEVVTASDGGQHSVCIFPDGECDAWDFLEGLCDRVIHCAQHD
jgi:putative hemolysin